MRNHTTHITNNKLGGLPVLDLPVLLLLILVLVVQHSRVWRISRQTSTNGRLKRISQVCAPKCLSFDSLSTSTAP